MAFVERYLRNLAIIALILAVAWGLLRTFYPAVLRNFMNMELFFGGVHLWPVLAVLVLLLALPLRRS